MAIESLARHVDKSWLAVGQKDMSLFVRETSRRLEEELGIAMGEPQGDPKASEGPVVLDTGDR